MSRKNRNARSVIHTQRNFSRNLISQPVQGQLTMNEVPIPATGKIACDAKCSYEYMRLPAAWLVTDTSYQRAIDEKAVERIVENFDPRLVNVIKVSHRDGRFYVFDGAHTLNALKRINGMNCFLVDCKVYRGLAYEDEAYLFALQTGESRDVAFSARLRALLISNSQEAVDFRESTQRAGLQLASGNSTASQDTIYRRYLEGSTVHEIAKALTAAGVPTPMKRKTWCETTVQSILTNEKYMGDAILQKTFCTDFLTKKMKKNEGELPQYHVRNSHPAIVSAEVFELVQMEIESRRQFGSRYSGRGVFASRIVCADCGGFYGSKVWHSNDPYRTVIWRCNRKYEKGMHCTTPHVKEEAIKAGFVQVMARLLASKQEVLEGSRQILDEVLTTDEQSRQIAKLRDQAVGLAQRIRGLVNENARTQMTEDEFTPEYDRLVSQYEKLAAKIATIQREKEDKEYRAKRISLFMRMLAEQEECLEFDPALFTAFVERVVVSGTKKDVRLRFVLRDESEYKIDGVR